jgi:hypothetical protein
MLLAKKGGLGKIISIGEVASTWHKQEADTIQKAESDLDYYTRQIAYSDGSRIQD